MDLRKRIESFIGLGQIIRDRLESEEDAAFNDLLLKAYQKNNWFTRENVRSALHAITLWLERENLEKWTAAYSIKEPEAVKEVGVIMAGNIPLVGFHDFLCVLISGHAIDAKLSSDDPYLLPAVSEWLIKSESGFAQRIFFSSRIEKPDAVIATGSNNTARYFEYYFGRYPNIIRSNRNSVAVLEGDETEDELSELGKDIFDYFGLGCRNVSKIYIPEQYDLKSFFQAIEKYSFVMSHNKYMNNYDYQNAVLLLNKIPFLTNNFLIVKESEFLSTPVSVLNYEFYTSENVLQKKLTEKKDQIQCIAGRKQVPFGKTQQPSLNDYADGIDVMKFLMKLK